MACRSGSTADGGWRTLAKIDDVARHAGVAPSTVSYVLSGKRTISEETRQRVLRSIQALGYHPHAGARALASNRSNVVALVIPLRTGIHVPVIMQFAISVVTSARRHDHDVLLLTQDEGVQGLKRVAGTALVDAIIVMDVELHDPRVPEGRPQHSGRPFGGGDLPGRTGRAHRSPADLGSHPGDPGRHAGRRVADGQARRPAGAGGHPARPHAHPPGEHEHPEEITDN